ncbi:MAG TPA: hypothetical protein VF637_15620 [Sphingomicrobium sp.]
MKVFDDVQAAGGQQRVERFEAGLLVRRDVRSIIEDDVQPAHFLHNGA